jgi:hypothetical protein
MDAEAKVLINLAGLPDEPNHHRLAVALEREVNEAVARALAEAYEDGTTGKDWLVHVRAL